MVEVSRPGAGPREFDVDVRRHRVTETLAKDRVTHLLEQRYAFVALGLVAIRKHDPPSTSGHRQGGLVTRSLRALECLLCVDQRRRIGTEHSVWNSDDIYIEHHDTEGDRVGRSARHRDRVAIIGLPARDPECRSSPSTEHDRQRQWRSEEQVASGWDRPSLSSMTRWANRNISFPSATWYLAAIGANDSPIVSSGSSMESSSPICSEARSDALSYSELRACFITKPVMPIANDRLSSANSHSSRNSSNATSAPLPRTRHPPPVNSVRGAIRMAIRPWVIGRQLVGDLLRPIPARMGRREVAVGQPRARPHMPLVGGGEIARRFQVLGDQGCILVGRAGIPLHDRFRQPTVQHRTVGP